MSSIVGLARVTTAALVLSSALPLGASAQSRDTTRADSTRSAAPLAAVTITATRSARSTFDTPQPIVVLDSVQLRSKLSSPADLFRDIAGLDASGVGSNQRRPEIRGLRGQRILLLQDGLRLNNARRQQDFGELPALAGEGSLARVEVVRGPSSVLYGSDAIGGVVNLISVAPPSGLTRSDVHGSFSYRYVSAGRASTPDLALSGRTGRLGFHANAAYRESDPYRAPSGTFGDITLDDDVRVRDSGVRDRSYNFALSYNAASNHELFFRGAWYSAERAGFGYVDPNELGPNQPLIQIRYPDQDFGRFMLGYRGRASLGLADRFELSTYTQRNERQLNTLVSVPIGPGANVTSRSFNFTDLTTFGGRAELAKVIGTRSVLTYGVDWFRDRSENTDSSMSTVTGFGPPSSRSSNRASVPNATFRNIGAFTQLELRPVERLTTTLGARFQDVAAETRPTPLITTPTTRSSDRSGVWSANALFRVFDDMNLVAAVGRGFRAANLVERFFEGTAAEGGGFQRANPDLDPETSLNVDLGLRYRNRWWYGEAFVFRNDIDDAIRSVATGDSVNRQPAFQSRNVGRLRIDGVEITTGARAFDRVDATASFARLDGRNISEPGSPIGDSYSNKVVGDVMYRQPGGRFTLGYTVRRQGKQKDVIIGSNPIGSVIPAFTVHSARGSLHLADVGRVRNDISFVLDNISDRLYAEFPNASFFRPEPGRHVRLAFVTTF
jgi:outer membrane receptor protein involved in Fe transport